MARSQHSFGSKDLPLRDLPAAALRAVFKEGYSKQDLKADILSGCVVGVVALPLAMALAIAVGVAPQAGLYTAIVAGLAVGLLGGSRYNITGPTAAFVVILSPIYIKHGFGGLLLSGLFAGFILIIMGLARFGKFIQFIPHPVTTGFTSGIATVIAILQLKDFLGLTIERSPEFFLERVAALIQALPTFDPFAFLIGAVTLALIVYVPKVTTRIPAPLIALTAAAILKLALEKMFPSLSLSTIGTQFQTVINGDTVSGIPQLLPLPSLPWNITGPNELHFDKSFSTIRELMPSAFAIAMLGAIESLLSAVVADGMAGSKHDPDSELIALGVGNVLCPFFGGIAATGAIARTATNVRYGARSPISSVVHALVILAAILILSPLLSFLPMAALAALLIYVAWSMANFRHFFHIVKVAPRSDVLILLCCFFLTVIFDMVTAVAVGVVLACVLFMKRMADFSSSKLITHGDPQHPVNLPEGVMLYEIAGPLFFGAAAKAMDAMRAINDQVKAVVLDMRSVPVMDETGLVAFESALGRLQKRQIFTVISDIQKQPAHVLEKAGIVRKAGTLEFSPNLDAAIELAAKALQKQA